MKRKIYQKLLDWKNTRAKECALLIEGARRTGKSYIVQEFAKNEYATSLILDFSQIGKNIQSLFENDLADLDTFFENLQIQTKTKLIPGKSLIVFDEVQRFPRAREAIKFLVADGRYEYIETGSLVGIKENVKNIQIPSEEYAIEMNPMDFEEFLWAIGDTVTFESLKTFFLKKIPLGQAAHRKVMLLFRHYLAIGGLPQAVKAYAETKDFIKVECVKRDILSLYRNDIRKYAHGYATKVTAIFDAIPSQLQRGRKKFHFSDLKTGARYRHYENSFFWLGDSRIVNLCLNVTEPAFGLKGRADNASLKCYMADTGLLISSMFHITKDNVYTFYQKFLLDKFSLNEGFIIENLIAQILRAKGYPLYFYYSASNNIEIDFLIERTGLQGQHNIIPIEVKSSVPYQTTSLNRFAKKFHQQIASPVILHSGDLKVGQDKTAFPLYMAPFLDLL